MRAKCGKRAGGAADSSSEPCRWNCEVGGFEGSHLNAQGKPGLDTAVAASDKAPRSLRRGAGLADVFISYKQNERAAVEQIATRAA